MLNVELLPRKERTGYTKESTHVLTNWGRGGLVPLFGDIGSTDRQIRNSMRMIKEDDKMLQGTRLCVCSKTTKNVEGPSNVFEKHEREEQKSAPCFKTSGPPRKSRNKEENNNLKIPN